MRLCHSETVQQALGVMMQKLTSPACTSAGPRPSCQNIIVRDPEPLRFHFLALSFPFSPALHGRKCARRIKRRGVLVKQPCHAPRYECPVHKIFVIMLTKHNPAFAREGVPLLQLNHAGQWLPRRQQLIVWQLPHCLSRKKRRCCELAGLNICACVSQRYFTMPTAPCGCTCGVGFIRRHRRTGSA